MKQINLTKRNQGIIDKFFALDFILILLILLLGIISIFAMYSSEQGIFSYHSKTTSSSFLS